MSDWRNSVNEQSVNEDKVNEDFTKLVVNRLNQTASGYSGQYPKTEFKDFRDYEKAIMAAKGQPGPKKYMEGLLSFWLDVSQTVKKEKPSFQPAATASERGIREFADEYGLDLHQSGW